MCSMSNFCTPQADSLVAFYTTNNWPNHEERSRHQSKLTWTFICAMVLLSSIFLDNPMKFRGLNHSSRLHLKKKSLTLASPSGHTPRAAPDSARTPQATVINWHRTKDQGITCGAGAGPGCFQPGGRRKEKTAFTAWTGGHSLTW